MRLTFTNNRSFMPTIAAEGNNIHVVWIETGYGRESFLWYMNSKDSGQTWSTPFNLIKDTTASASSPKIAIYENNIHVIWMESYDKKVHYIRSSDNGNTWFTEVIITPTVYSLVSNWDIGVYGKNLHVVYIDTHFKLSYIKSIDNGTTWCAPEVLISNHTKAVNSAIAVNGKAIHIVWEDIDRAGYLNSDIYYIRSDDNGVTWTIDINISNSTLIKNYYIDIETENNFIYVIYGHEEGPRQIYMSYSRNNGIEWINNIKLTNSSQYISYPSISAAKDKIFIVWTDRRDGTNQVYYKYSSDYGDSWCNDTRLSIASPFSSWPDIYMDNNRAYIVWSDTRDGNGEIYFKQYSEKINISLDIDPDTLNLKSKGRWITCYIDLPEGYDVNEIDINTILLEDTIPAEWGDVQGTTLMVKFDRAEVEDILDPNEEQYLTVTMNLVYGSTLQSQARIRVI